MRLRAILAACVLVMAASAPLSAQGHTLTVTVDGVANPRGVVGVLVYKSAQGWPEDNASAFRSKAVPAQIGSVTVAIPDLPPGDYAVVVLHDENENQKLDRNWLGQPKEQWGMSNNPAAHFSAPSFSQARFAFAADSTIHVHLR